jgi:mono/diheme cytochrome c family protein
MSARIARTAVLCLLAAAPAAMAMSFAGLEQLIVDRNIRSIEDLLPLLPADLRSRYVLMFRSRSLHGSSYAHPRAILFDPEARLVISFNGDASQAGFGALETMEFDDAGKSFRFHEITFPADAGGDGHARFSQPNPEPCLKCHGDPPRPVWDTHPGWPGAYGERYGAALTAPERSGLQQFLREQPDHPRYRWLLEIDRFASPETFRPAARTRYEGTERLPPNAELGAALGRLNFEAIVHQLEAQPQFDAHKYALMAALGTDCGRLDAFFPDAQRDGIDKGLDRFAAASAHANAAQVRLKRLRAVGGADPGAYAKIDGVESIDRFRYVVETRFGLSTSQWTTALEKGSYDFAWSPSAAAEMASYLRKRLAQTDPQTRDLADFRTFSGGDPYCAYLVRRSRAALAADGAAAGRSATVPASGLARTQALLDQCAGCHLSGVGPRLPFDHPPELAALLRSGRFTHGTLMDEIRWRLAPQAGAGRMPLGTNISDEERDALLQYFGGVLRQGATN